MAERRIFLAIDGSKSSDVAFNWYLKNVCREGDDVFIVHAAEYNVNIGLPGAAADFNAIGKAVKEEDDRISSLLSNHLDILRKKQYSSHENQPPSQLPEIRCQSKKLVGMKPGEAIVKAAEEEGADMIIMGSRGHGIIRRTLLGSVSEYVSHHAPSQCAVTVIRDS